MRITFIIALAFAGCVTFADQASAQFGGPNVPNYGPGYRGNISPYLNLFRGRTNGGGFNANAIDYYLGTRAEQQRRQNASEFRDEIDDIERRDRIGDVPDDEGRDRPIETGTSTRFGSTLGFYNNRQNFLAPTAGRLGGGSGSGFTAAPGRRR